MNPGVLLFACLLWGGVTGGGEQLVLRLVASGGWMEGDVCRRGGPWPEREVWVVLPASADEALAVFSDYKDQLRWLPDLREASPEGGWGEDVSVAFRMNVPFPLKDTRYASRNLLRRYPEGGGEVSWVQLRSDSARDSEGFARFYVWGPGRSVLHYRSWVHPRSALAGLFAGRFRKGLARTVTALRK